jgi:valyl-tRNA synthetase
MFANNQATNSKWTSIHTSEWPKADESLIDDTLETHGDKIIAIATIVRRYKSEQNLSLGTELKRLQLMASDPVQRDVLTTLKTDVASITRAVDIEITNQLDPNLENILSTGEIEVGIEA